MKKKKIKNPLIRRIPRELLGDWKKYTGAKDTESLVKAATVFFA